MRIRVRLPEVGTEVKRFPQECPYCGSKLLKLHQRCTKQIRDTMVSSVNVLRVRCLRCERTFRAYPDAVTFSQHSQRLKAIAVLMYVLGLSYGAVEDVLSALGVRLSKSTVFRDVQLRRIPPQFRAPSLTPVVGGRNVWESEKHGI